MLRTKSCSHRGRAFRPAPARAAATVGLVAATFAVGAPVAASGSSAAARGWSPAAHEVRAPAPVLRPPAIPVVGAYFGADPNFAEGVSTPKQAAQLGHDIHRSLSVVSFYEEFNTPAPTVGMSQVAATGAVPMINVNCGASDASIAGGAYDSLLRSQAIAYRDYGRPVLYRWFWEMNLAKVNGHPACLGAPGSAAAQYVAAFRHIWQIFRNEGATNVAFVWAPSDARSAPPPDAYYPGSPYVSWIGADIYDRPGYTDWSSMYAGFYRKWSVLGKPLILSETGAVTSAAQATWITNISMSMPAQFPDLHAFVYVDAIDLSNYTLVNGTAGMAAYASMGSSTYFSAAHPQDVYRVAATSGGVQTFGCPNLGSEAGKWIPAAISGVVEDPAQSGYWLVGRDGSVYPFGSARGYGSMRGRHLNAPIVGLATTADGRGYWLVASDGGIFTYGDAKYYGSMGGHKLNRPIVGIAPGPRGLGYWEVASDGGIFSFGDAKFHGSTGGRKLNRPIVGMAPTPPGSGYWLVASDGGVFAFSAPFHGSLPAYDPGHTAVGMAVDPRTEDYRIATTGGTVYQFPGGAALSPVVPLGSTVGVATIN